MSGLAHALEMTPLCQDQLSSQACAIPIRLCLATWYPTDLFSSAKSMELLGDRFNDVCPMALDNLYNWSLSIAESVRVHYYASHCIHSHEALVSFFPFAAQSIVL